MTTGPTTISDKARPVVSIDETVLRDLVAKEEIRDGLARYVHGNDRNDPELLASVFHPDATFDMGLAKVTGGHFGAAKPATSTRLGFHLLGQSLIRVDGDRAVSETYLYDVMQSNDDGHKVDVIVLARYVDQWERRHGGPFKIADRRIVWDSVRTNTIQATYPGPDTDVVKVELGGSEYDGDGITWGEYGPGDHGHVVLEQLGLLPSRAGV